MRDLHRLVLILLVLSFAARAGADTEQDDALPATVFKVSFFFEPLPQPGTITLAVSPVDGPSADDVIEVAIDAPRGYELELHHDRTWKVSCNGTHYWCPESTIEAGKVGSALEVPIFQAAMFSGRATSRGRQEPDGNLVIQGSLRLSGGPSATAPSSIVSFTQYARIMDNGKFEFKGPEGTVDLRIAAEGWIPIYIWGFASSMKSADLGDLKFRMGSSLSGFVWDSVTDLPADGAAVTMKEAGLVPGAAPEDRATLLTHTAKTNDRGFFQISGVPSGVYRLEVTAASRALRTFEPVEILEDSETVLTGKVVLSPLLRAEVHLEPLTGAHGEPWSVRFRPQRHGLGDDWEKTAVSDDLGVAVFSDLVPQTYTLEVYDSAGDSRYLMTEVKIEEDSVLFYEVPVLELFGTVTLNEEPLEATIEIATGSNDQSTFRSEPESGEFSGVIRKPEHDLLLVKVRSEEPRFSRRLVVPDPDIEDGRMVVEINLVGIDVPGFVVDTKGLPVAGARVDAWSGQSVLADVETDFRGEFTLQALGAGHYELQARSESKGDSELAPLDLRKGASPSPQRLVLVSRKALAGALRSANGEPLAGAQVTVMTVGLRPTTETDTTGVEGKFRLRVGAEATHALFQVLAPSQVLWSGCVALDARTAADPLVLTLPSLPGGRLEVIWTGKVSGPPDTTSTPILVTSDSGYLTFNEFWNWTVLTGNPEGMDISPDHWVFPRLAGGRQYAVLRTSDAPWQIVASLCLLGPSPDLDWVYVPDGGTERIEIDVTRSNGQGQSSR